jgi:hypothetical protein
VRRSSLCVVTPRRQFGFCPRCFLISCGVTAWRRLIQVRVRRRGAGRRWQPGAGAECLRDKRHERHTRSQFNAVRLSVVSVHFGDQCMCPPSKKTRRHSRVGGATGIEPSFGRRVTDYCGSVAIRLPPQPPCKCRQTPAVARAARSAPGQQVAPAAGTISQFSDQAQAHAQRGQDLSEKRSKNAPGALQRNSLVSLIVWCGITTR